MATKKDKPATKTAKASKPAAKKSSTAQAAAPKKTTAKKPAAAVKKPGGDGASGDTHEKVQLWKDGPYWATTNIGAEKPEDFGYYFWWGDTVGYKRVKNKWVATDGSSSDFSFDWDHTPSSCDEERNYEDKADALNLLEDGGWITNDEVLTPEHDAAHVQWGGDWRMPTYMELWNLLDKCNWRRKKVNGVEGYVVRGKGAYASASIFLPAAAGVGSGTSLDDAGSGYYWSSIPIEEGRTWDLILGSDHREMCAAFRFKGQSVRPVQGFTK